MTAHVTPPDGFLLQCEFFEGPPMPDTVRLSAGWHVRLFARTDPQTGRIERYATRTWGPRP